VPRRVPCHDRDAGGAADVLAAKAAIREEVWDALTAARVARFPGAAGRIPNFTGLIGPDTIVVTTVHELQVRLTGSVPVTDHDVPVDLVITPERIIDCRHRRGPRPATAICWPELTEEKIASIPLLAALRPAH
jgi:5-formyltetrahydrofolate cyclo-ligase